MSKNQNPLIQTAGYVAIENFLSNNNHFNNYCAYTTCICCLARCLIKYNLYLLLRLRGLGTGRAHVHNFRLACERHKIIWLWSCTKVPLLADAPPLSKCFHSLCSDCIFAMCAGGVRNMFRAQDKECSLTCCTLLTIESSRKDPHSPHGENFCCPEGEGRQISFWYLY